MEVSTNNKKSVLLTVLLYCYSSTFLGYAYKSGPTMSIADPLSRLARQEHQLDNLDLPLMLEMLLKELPSSVRATH